MKTPHPQTPQPLPPRRTANGLEPPRPLPTDTAARRMAHRDREAPDPAPTPLPSRPKPLPPRPAQPPKGKKEKVAADVSDRKELELMIITEASVAAVMRLASRIRDLEGVVGLWREFEGMCNDSKAFDHVKPNYADELRAAMYEINRALQEVQHLAYEGMGTEDEGLVEKRAKSVVLKYRSWKQQQKQRHAEVRKVDEVVCGGVGSKKEENGTGKEPGVNGGRDGLGVGIGKEMVDKSKVVQVCGVENLHDSIAEAFKVVEHGLDTGAKEQEGNEILEMRKKLLEHTKQTFGNSAQKIAGKTDEEKVAY